MGFAGSIAVRAELNRTEPLEVSTKRPGRLFAVLWHWDYGILAHGPQPRSNLNGWKLQEEETGKISDAPAPFSSLPLYSFQLESGRHKLRLTEYFGQWVIVGFKADDRVAKNGFVAEVELVGSKTRHHVYDPGREVRSKAANSG